MFDNKLRMEKPQQRSGSSRENNQTSYVKYDYSFELKINNDIICQRYFNITGFNENSLQSVTFKEYFDVVCNLIQKDLESKTRVYLYNVCSTFANEEMLTKRQQNGLYKSELYSPLHDEFDPSYGNTDTNNITFSFSYKDNIMMMRTWDGNVYPQFIRKNIDIVNNQWVQVTPTKRIYFDTCDDDKLKYEHTIKKKIFVGRQDLIPQIIALFRKVCVMQNTDLSFYEYAILSKNTESKILYFADSPFMQEHP